MRLRWVVAEVNIPCKYRVGIIPDSSNRKSFDCKFFVVFKTEETNNRPLRALDNFGKNVGELTEHVWEGEKIRG